MSYWKDSCEACINGIYEEMRIITEEEGKTAATAAKLVAEMIREYDPWSTVKWTDIRRLYRAEVERKGGVEC